MMCLVKILVFLNLKQKYMNLIYYKSKKGNFGDDLNKWLWPKIFGNSFFNKKTNIAFLGIGSILIENSVFLDEANKFDKKIVFGTGVRSINESIEIDDSWDIKFLRGPYSSLKLTGDLNNYIADGAYFIALLPEYKNYLKTEKKHKVSFIPYFQSIDKVDWQKICDEMNWNLILPTDSVENFIEEIAASETVISEAMHGAMIADILRVPWKRMRFYSHVYEGEKVSEFKWNDWLQSIDFYKNLYIDTTIKKRKGIYKILKKAYLKKNEKLLLDEFKYHEKIPFRLSSESTFNIIVEKLSDQKKIMLEDKRI